MRDTELKLRPQYCAPYFVVSSVTGENIVMALNSNTYTTIKYGGKKKKIKLIRCH